MRKHTTRLLLAAMTCATIGLAASQAHVAPAEFPPKPWASLAWDQEVGRIQGNESDSEGPKAFAVDPDGGVLLLDQVNQRILRFDASGARAGEIGLPASTFDDVEQYEGRAVLALDRLVGKRLLVLDPKGAVLVDVAVEGRGIERAGLITAMLPRPDGVWLEVQHRHSVKVLDRDLAPCERQVVVGRPIVNGRSLHAALDDRGGVKLSTRARNERREGGEVTLVAQSPIRRIVWSDADPAGRIHVVLHEAEFATVSPYRVKSERYWMVELDEQLREVQRVASPWVLTEYDQRVEFRVGRDGRLWQMALTPQGVQIVDWGRRAP